MLKPVVQFYDARVLPYLIDWACGINVISRQRQKVVPLAYGDVLEIGLGTGLNLRHYDRLKVVQLTGIDPGLAHGKVQKRIRQSGLSVTLVDLSAERLPFADGVFDSVVVTYSLCTIPDPIAALREMYRVMKPEGQLLYCEHGLAPDERVRRRQQQFTGVWSKLAGGCQLNRHIPTLITAAGFVLDEVTDGYVPGPKMLSYNYWGRAKK